MERKAAVLRAINHLDAFGDTDLFPTLPEMKCFVEEAAETANVLAKLTSGNYHPSNCCEILTPKSWLGFRISHQLTATDSIVYLSSVIEAGESLESIRLDESLHCAFSYRYQEDDVPKIFKSGYSYHDWIAYTQIYLESSKDKAFSTVLYTDISDFYQRIYFHRIENILNDAGIPNQVAGKIEKLIQKIRAKQSFGIPVGSAGSRLLAECVLADTDRYLLNEGVSFTRYVDDFRIFAQSDDHAHQIACMLAEHLMATEGLSLNSSKTSIRTRKQATELAAKRLGDAFSSKEMQELHEMIRVVYGEDEEEQRDDSDPFQAYFMDGDDLVKRMSELWKEEGIELSVFKAILRALRVFEDVNLKRVLEEVPMLLYYMPREFCLLIRSHFEKNEADQREITRILSTALVTSPYSDLTFVRYWILDLFIRGPLDFGAIKFSEYDFGRSVPERRAGLLLRGLASDRAYFRRMKTRFTDFNDWERPALVLGAMCLPEDEFKNWVDSITDAIPGSLNSVFASWAKRRHSGGLQEVLEAT